MDASKLRVTGEIVTDASLPGEPPRVTALVERAKAGDPAAFDDLMILYEGRIIAIGLQMGLSRDDALDACQDAFIKVFRYIRSFRSGQSFFNWLHRIAVNAIYDHLSWRHPAGTVSLEEVDNQAAAFCGAQLVESRVDSADQVRKLLRGLEYLTRQERIVFVLRDMQQMTTAEIGKILRLSQITVRRHCASARQRLRNHLLSPTLERKRDLRGR